MAGGKPREALGQVWGEQPCLGKITWSQRVTCPVDNRRTGNAVMPRTSELDGTVWSFGSGPARHVRPGTPGLSGNELVCVRDRNPSGGDFMLEPPEMKR